MTRALRAVLGGHAVRGPLYCCGSWVMTATPSSRSTSHQRGLAAAQAAQGDQVVGGVETVVTDGMQELGRLRRGPHRYRRSLTGLLPVLDTSRRPHHRPRTAGP